MNPYQHSEVYVTDDGVETDLDLGHYERFLDISMGKLINKVKSIFAHPDEVFHWLSLMPVKRRIYFQSDV